MTIAAFLVPDDVKQAAREAAARICPHHREELRAAFIEANWVIVAGVVMADRRGRPNSESERIPPTAQQHAVLAFLRTYLADHGVSPSFEQIAAHLGHKSKSSAFRLITGLEERGHIRRLPNRARAIEVVP